MSETRVDPTVAGLFLVGFITLIFGLIGLTTGMENTASVGLLEFALFIVMPLAVIFLVLMYMASKVGNAYATALFAFVVAALIAVQSAVGGVEGSSFALYVIAIFFILFALVAFFIGAPKLLSIQLFFTALLYLFVGLFLAADDGKTMALIFGVFGVLASAVATYMALALAQEKVKLPMF